MYIGLSDSLQSIDDSAFNGCIALTTIRIGISSAELMDIIRNQCDNFILQIDHAEHFASV
ncbi:MAG: hypothetical protein JW811_05525 [Clostridiales bacterium]|nr:hypothetical protein [Clostridiales bacterium]